MNEWNSDRLELLPVTTYVELAPWMQEAIALALRAMKTEDA